MSLILDGSDNTGGGGPINGGREGRDILGGVVGEWGRLLGRGIKVESDVLDELLIGHVGELVVSEGVALSLLVVGGDEILVISEVLEEAGEISSILHGGLVLLNPQTSSWTGFSEQELVSCNTKGDHGCNGGLMDRAFTYVQNNHGLCSEAAYPYTSGTTGENGSCLESTCTIDSKLNIKSHTDVQTNSDSALMSALAQQPVSVAIQANQPAFQFYKEGVMTGTCGANLDHGVLAVGYGTYTDGTDFYKVKNSWGSGWGMDGYILLQRGGDLNNGAGQCGILAGPPSYPNMA